MLKRTRGVSPPRIVPDPVLRILDTELETVKDENAANAQLLELLQLSLNIRSKRKGKPAEGNEKGFASRRVVEVLVEVVGGIDADDGSFEAGESEGICTAGSPVI